MRKLTWAALLLMFTVACVLAQEVAIDAGPELRVDQEHTQWIQHVMRSISTIKPGMTRKDLGRVLAEDGGLSFRSQGRYLYRHCPFIKVDVQFSPVDEEINQSPDDKIVKVSRPYLEYAFKD
jgi:hypothetical protein